MTLYNVWRISATSSQLYCDKRVLTAVVNNKYNLKQWQDRWNQEIINKLHGIHFFAGMTPYSFGKDHTKPVVLTRFRINHCRFTKCIPCNLLIISWFHLSCHCFKLYFATANLNQYMECKNWIFDYPTSPLVLLSYCQYQCDRFWSP
jgi:hypothetical protein